MRQWLVLTGFLFMVSGVNAQSFFSPKPPTDTILQHWPQVDFIQIKDSSGFVLEEGYLKKGERDGVWTTFHRSGVPHTVTSYRMGKKNGSSLKMGADGYLEESATYMDDVLHGPFRTYLKGARMGKEIYYKQGIEDGMRKVYYFD
ncbi:MAG TPA: hypothetical protein PLP14_11265, partial [Chitinophagaceae bacterium]|nr:hypothetical protein [Chitinophagaceae bacterium]